MLRRASNTTNKTKQFFSKQRIIAVSLAGLVVAGIAVPSSMAYADRLQDQINSLNQQNAITNDSVGQLGSEAVGLKETIAKLEAEIANLQNQIVVNDNKRTETIAGIAQAEAELARQKATLGDNVKAMYVDGSMSKLEELATSKNLSEFADQQQYRVSVQNKIQKTLTSINDLKAKLATEKANVERMIVNLQEMRAKVASQQAEQSRLLSLNQAQQTELNGQIKANSDRVAALRQQQADENARLFNSSSSNGRSSGAVNIPQGVPGGGGYPGKWAFAPIDQYVDPWGMFTRECVSYTAWKVADSGRYMPYWGGRGNAKQWDDNARAAGIPVDTNPRVGDVAVSNAGTWGHVMYVERVASDGAIYVSDYNQQFDGNYREYWISAANVSSKQLVFIHF